MIKSLVSKEWLQLKRDGRLKLGGGFWLVLGLAACINGLLDYRETIRIAEESNRKARDHWMAQETKNPHSAAHYGTYVFKQPHAAMVFDPGVTPYSGTSVFVEAHRKNDATHLPISARTSLARFGNFSPAFFLIWLVPLIAILLFFGAVAGERDSGALKAVAATGIPARRWLFGKWLILWTLPAFSLGLVLIFSLIFAVDSQTKFGLWLLGALGYFLYFGGVVNIILLVSAKARNAPRACLVLLSLWMLGSLVAPRAAVNLAERLYPTPLKHGFKETIAQEKKTGIEAHMGQIKEETLGQYQVLDTADLPINYDALRMQSDEEFTDQLNDRHYARLYANQRNQINLYRACALIWPLMPARLFSMGLAQTDMAAHHHFNQQTEAYRRQFVKILNDDMMHNSRTGDWGYQAHTSTWERVPEFRNEPRSVREVVRDTAPDLGILLLWFTLSAGWLFVPANRLFGSMT